MGFKILLQDHYQFLLAEGSFLLGPYPIKVSVKCLG